MSRKYLQSIALIVCLGSVNPIFPKNSESDNNAFYVYVLVGAASVAAGIVVGIVVGDAAFYTIKPLKMLHLKHKIGQKKF